MVKIQTKTSKIAQLRALSKDLKRLKSRVGWFESAKYGDGTPVAGVAAVQEFGSPATGTPPRPFMRPTVAEKEGAWKELVKTLTREAVKNGRSAKDIYEILGTVVAGDIKKAIVDMSSPELSQVTLALRKHKGDGKEITGALVHAVMRAVARGETAPGQLGDSSGVSTKVLVFEAIMLNTLSSEVTE